MKNLFLILLAVILFNLPAFAQWTTVGTNTYNTPLTNNVGIGTATPNSLLEVVGSSNPAISVGTGKVSEIEIGIASCNTCYALGADIDDGVIRYLGQSGNLILTNNGGLVNSGGFLFKTGSSYSKIEKTRMEITNTGKVLIGLESKTCTLPTDGILGVNGTIYATKIKVKALTAGCFPDYVFEKNYKLKSLSEVETFINKNKHLPEVPSAKEIENSDLDLAEMNALLLKKIEELTLYVIQHEKQINELKK